MSRAVSAIAADLADAARELEARRSEHVALLEHVALVESRIAAARDRCAELQRELAEPLAEDIR